MEKTSPPLADLQYWLRWIFMEPRGLRALDDLGPEEPKPRLLGWIADGPPIPRSHRLAVYSDAYFIRLHESLAANFPALKRALGAERFRRLVAEYVAGHPSDSPCVDDFGARLPEFLSSHPFSQEQPFLSDLARLEWNVLCSLYSDRHPRLDPAKLRDFSPDDWWKINLRLDPTVRLLQTQWPVDRLWRTQKPVSLRRPAARYLLLNRNEEWVRVKNVGKAAFQVLSGLTLGKTLGELMEDTASHSRQDPAAVQAWFGEWVAAGVLT